MSQDWYLGDRLRLGTVRSCPCKRCKESYVWHGFMHKDKAELLRSRGLDIEIAAAKARASSDWRSRCQDCIWETILSLELANLFKAKYRGLNKYVRPSGKEDEVLLVKEMMYGTQFLVVKWVALRRDRNKGPDGSDWKWSLATEEGLDLVRTPSSGEEALAMLKAGCFVDFYGKEVYASTYGPAHEEYFGEDETSIDLMDDFTSWDSRYQMKYGQDPKIEVRELVKSGALCTLIRY